MPAKTVREISPKVGFIMILALALTSCSQELNYSRSQPPVKSLVGHWELDEASRRFLLDSGEYKVSQHFIDLLDDGEFNVVNMPDWWGDLRPHGRLDSGIGHWKVRQYEWYWAVELTFMPTDGDGPESMTIAVEGQRPPYRLHVRFGDPDSDIFIRFVRAGSPNTRMNATHPVVTALAQGSKRRAGGRARYAQR